MVKGMNGQLSGATVTNANVVMKKIPRREAAGDEGQSVFGRGLSYGEQVWNPL
jgi:hypothetical protein